MAKFQETVDRLVSTLTDEIFAAIQRVPLSELSAITGTQPRARGALAAPTGPKTPVAARAKNASAGVRARKAAAAPAPIDPEVPKLALAFVTERGRKGATTQQLRAHLASLGFSVTADILGPLAQRGAIRDAGFRRATGNGNATEPVYVLSGGD